MNPRKLSDFLVTLTTTRKQKEERHSSPTH